MPDKIHTITAGNRPVYEVVEPEDGDSITIRYVATDRPEQVSIPVQALPNLVRILEGIRDRRSR